MSDWDEWEVDELMEMYHLLVGAHDVKEAERLSEKLDRLDRIDKHINNMDKSKLRLIIEKLVDIVAHRTGKQDKA